MKMKDKKPDYPSAHLAPCLLSPISDDEQRELLIRLAREPIFRGAWTITRTGLPVAILHALDKSDMRVARENFGGVLVWNWPMRFGRLVSFSIARRKESMPRMFVPIDSQIVQAVSEHGRIALAVSDGISVSPFCLAEFGDEKLNPGMLKELHTVFTFAENEDYLFRHDDLCFWDCMAWSKGHWHKDLPGRELLRANWAITYASRVRDLNGVLQKVRKNGVTDPYTSSEGRLAISQSAPFLHEVLLQLVNPELDLRTLFSEWSSAICDASKIGDIVHGLFTEGALVEPIKLAMRECFLASLLGPESTLCGKRRPWLDGRTDDGGVAVKYIDLNLQTLSEHTTRYWTDFELNELFDSGHVITGKDVPVSRAELFESSETLLLECSEAEADAAIREFLAEARESRQWTIPWGSRVRVELGLFRHVDVYELDGEFLGFFRDRDERFMMVSANALSEEYSAPQLLRANKDKTDAEINSQASLIFSLVFAAIVRDFVVVEERERAFLAKTSRQTRCAVNEELSVVYLPRVRYAKPNWQAIADFGKEIRDRSPHSVSAHLRKSENPSAGQLVLAMRYGFRIPRGFTFVRPHRRGDEQTLERKREYRSRSASDLIFTTLATTPSGVRPAWFDFEKDVALLLRKLALEVVHRSASRRGDGGIDLYAFDNTSKSGWAIQCKCYSLSRKIGPNVIRELQGSLHRYPEGTRGMVVTTSAFTNGAVREAGTLNIELIDGESFAALRRRESR